MTRIITEDHVINAAKSVARRNVGASHTITAPENHPHLIRDRGGAYLCLYTYEDGSNCLVGAILKACGVPVPTHNSITNGSTVYDVADWLESRDIALDIHAEYFLGSIQALGDEGFYWNDAVAQAVG